MPKGERKNVYKVYNQIASWFAVNRDTGLMEKPYLDAVITQLPDGANVLDLGCGTGNPILAYLLLNGLKVTGVDASKAMLDIAKTNFPDTPFVLQDMRMLSLDQKFNAIIAWHSFFHLSAIDQPAMFETFFRHLLPGGLLLFTSGTERGEAWGINGGEHLFHASLDTAEYNQILTQYNFKVLKHVVNDPACGYATIWLAQYIPASDPE